MKSAKPKQLDMFKKGENAYGGELRNRRKGRGERSLSTKHTMHLVLRSSIAKGPWSLRRHQHKIKNVVRSYTHKYGVRLISLANVGNHLHMQIQLTNRHTYRPFIKAMTSALVISVTGANYKCSILARAIQLGVSPEQKTAPNFKQNAGIRTTLRFWDYRPFTRIVRGYKDFLTLRDYIEVNQFEGRGYDRGEARFLIFVRKQMNLENTTRSPNFSSA